MFLLIIASSYSPSSSSFLPSLPPPSAISTTGCQLCVRPLLRPLPHCGVSHFNGECAPLRSARTACSLTDLREYPQNLLRIESDAVTLKLWMMTHPTLAHANCGRTAAHLRIKLNDNERSSRGEQSVVRLQRAIRRNHN